jgi:hypothetical protein
VHLNYRLFEVSAVDPVTKEPVTLWWFGGQCALWLQAVPVPVCCSLWLWLLLWLWVCLASGRSGSCTPCPALPCPCLAQVALTSRHPTCSPRTLPSFTSC